MNVPKGSRIVAVDCAPPHIALDSGPIRSDAEHERNEGALVADTTTNQSYGARHKQAPAL